MMDIEELKTIEREVIERIQVLGCESDLSRPGVGLTNEVKAKTYPKTGRKSWGWEKTVVSVDEAALANGKGFYALGGAFVKKGEDPKGCVLKRLTDGDYVALKDGVEIATTTTGEEAGFTGPLAGVNTHAHAKVLWALWKELKS